MKAITRWSLQQTARNVPPSNALYFFNEFQVQERFAVTMTNI